MTLSVWWSWLCLLRRVHLVAPHDEFSIFTVCTNATYVHDAVFYIIIFPDPVLAFLKPDISMLISVTNSSRVITWVLPTTRKSGKGPCYRPDGMAV